MPFGKRIEHQLKCCHAGLMHEAAAVIARTADRANAEPCCGNRVDLAVTMPRHQHIDAMLCFARNRREQMLAVPKCQDDRHVGFAALVNIRRLECEARRRSDKAQILGGGYSDCRLSPLLSADVPPYPPA